MAVLKYLDTTGGKREWKEFFIAQNGISFLPSIDKFGNLVWENNGNLPNPESINLHGDTVIMRDTKAQFPTVGVGYCIYVDCSTSVMYRYDPDQQEYVGLSASPSTARGVIFVDTVPLPKDAELGIIYAVKGTDGQYELWTKQNGEMVLIVDNPAAVTDLEIDANENLHLVDADGNKVGEGIDIDEIGNIGGNDIILDDTPTYVSDGFDIILDDDIP